MLLKHFNLVFITLCCTVFSVMAQEKPSYTFGVLAQRSAVLTAQYWNPILTYVSLKSDISLVLKVERTAPESNEATRKGEYDFVYSNTIFEPQMDQANYQVILRPEEEAITGQIVTLENSPIHTLNEMEGKEMGFPSLAAFVGYALPMDYLLRQGIKVIPIFGGNQEGIMAQLKAGKLIVVAVNSQVMRAYATRENIAYRVLWESEKFLNIPIAVHPRISKEVMEKVQKVFDEMNDDPEGFKILETSAKLVGQKPPFGFSLATSVKYENYRNYFDTTLIKELKRQ